MKATGRLLALVLVVGALSSACTDNGDKADGNGTRTTGPATTGPSSTAVVTASGPPGTAVYVYQNAGLTATLDLDGNTGTLEIDNQTGRELAPPGFYLLDARDGSRVDGTIDGAATTPDGQTTDFDVSYSGLELKNIGLVVLLIGADNYGAFVRS